MADVVRREGRLVLQAPQVDALSMAASRMSVDPGFPLHRKQRIPSGAMLLLGLVLLPLAVEAQQPTMTSLTTTPSSPSNYLQLVTFTATVTGLGGASPTGTVTFTNRGEFPLCTPVQLQLAQCDGSVCFVYCATATLPVGVNSITAAYSGDSSYSPSSGSIPYTVQGNMPTTTLSVSPPAPVTGQVVTLTATVSNGGDPVTSGTVTFSNSETLETLGTVQLVQAGAAAGTATLKTRFAPGNYFVFASFNGTLGNQASGAEADFTVTGTEPSLTTLTDQPDGNNFDFTATVFGFGFPAATGQVKFNDLTDGFNLGNVVLSGPGVSSFQPQQTYGTGKEPLGVAVGDFNGDGFADLAVTNQPDNTISVLLGNGDGTFQPQQTYQVGVEPSFIAVADFNGDGIPDLAVTNFVGDTVSVLLGKGDGTFQPPQTFPVGAGPVGVAVGDFNGDGFADLAVANFYDGTVGVLLGKGDGTFQPQQVFEVGQEPYGLAIADFNGDGIADIVVANFLDSTVSVLLGQGDGTFQPQQTYPVGLNPYWVASGDLNQDGIPDLAVANGGANSVSVLLGVGDGTFQPQQAYPVGITPTSVVIADFNGDGLPDLATANVGVNTVSVLLGVGDGVFQPQQTYVTGNGPYSVAAADFNGDGVPDLAAPISGDASVSILLGGTTIAAQLNNVPVAGSGNHMIQGSYVPDAASIYAASVSNTVTVPAGGKTTPSVTLTASPLTANYGINVSFTAEVQSPGGGTPTGTVNFMEGSNLLGTASLVANAGGQGSVANYTNNTLVIGTHEVTATYNGDSNFNSATSAPPVTVTVITPFMLIPQNGNSGTVSPGGNITFSVAVNAAWQDQPLIYAVMTCKPPAGTGITCSVTCPPSPSKPPGLTNLCVLTQMTGTVATVTVNTGGAARLIPPLHRGGERRVVATLMGLGGTGLVGLVLLPVRLRSKATAGILLVVIVMLCFGTSCGTSFAPGSSSPPVNNTFYISVNAELREENPLASTGYNALGVQVFLYALLIK
jgi:Big-like domain-containing protein/VCBS repeat protein/FG-GAP repeat protein